MKKVKLFLLCALIASCAHSKSSSPSKLFDFKTDVCTLFPDHSESDPNQDWSHCCVAHDIEYWLGGPKKRKEAADQELKSCVVKTGASQAGDLMYTGVNVGGTPYLQTPWAWAYGWRSKSSYSRFNNRQLQMISHKIDSVFDVINSYKKSWSPEQFHYVQKRLRQIKDDLSLSTTHDFDSKDYNE
jgi:hypothetical protein